MEQREVSIEQAGPLVPPRVTCDGQPIALMGLSYEFDPVDRVGLATIELPAQALRLQTMASFVIPGERELVGAVDFALAALETGDPTQLAQAASLLRGGLSEYRGVPDVRYVGQ